MPKMLIQNNNGGIVSIQLPPPGGAKADGSTVSLGKVIDLAPGTTEVEKADWEQALQNPVVKRLLVETVPMSHAPEQDQRFVGRPKLVAIRELADENPLAKIKTPEAKKIIEETLDTATLERWFAQETRDELRKVIRAQINEINAPYLGKGGASVPPSEMGQ